MRSSETILANIPLPRGEMLRVEEDKAGGVVLRRFFPSTNGTLKPGRDGIAISRQAFERLVDCVRSRRGGGAG